jgi:hypothetical protein
MFLGELKDAIDGLKSPDREIAQYFFFGKGSAEERNRATVDALGEGTSESVPRNFQSRALESVARALLESDGAGNVRPSVDALIGRITRILSSAYPDNSSLEQLARMVLPRHFATEGVEITLTLRDVRDNANLYNLLITSTTMAEPGSFLLALTPRATLSDLVVTTCPHIAEVFACSNQDNVQTYAEEWAHSEQALLTTVSKNAQGLATRTQLPFEIVTEEDKKEILEKLPESARREVAVLAARVPRENGQESPVPIELRQPATMERCDHYCYWLADRPTFVKRIVVDWSGLTLPNGQRVRLRPTIRATAYEARSTDQACVMDINSWLVTGQGILIIWG